MATYTNDKLEQYPTKAQEIKDGFTQKVEKLKENDSLSAKGKSEKAEKLRSEIAADIQELQNKYNEKISEVRTKLTDKAFALNGASKAEALQFDDVVYNLSKRDVKPSERTERLQQGSAITAQAVAKASLVAGDKQTLNKYGELYPDKAADIRTLLEFEKSYGRHKDANIKMKEKFAFSKPSRPDFSR